MIIFGINYRRNPISKKTLPNKKQVDSLSIKFIFMLKFPLYKIKPFLIWVLFFISIKISNAQTFQWAFGTGGNMADVGLGIAVDNSGNIYYSGSFKGTADFDPGPGTFTLSSVGALESIFILKLDSMGNFVWAKNIITAYSRGESIKVDLNGNIFVTGSFIGTGDFDPGPGVFNMTSNGTSNGDIFISKLDSTGDFVWAKKIGSIGDDRGQYVTADSIGNIYVTGYFSYSADFDPGAGVYVLSSAGDADVFILKLDNNGNLIYALKAGGPYTDRGFEIKVSPSGNVFTTGHFAGTADFDPGPGVYNLTYVDLYDVFVMKTDASGNFVWARGMVGMGYNWGFSIDLDSHENVYTAGEFRSTIDLDPGPAIHNITPVGSGNNTFISKLDSSGNFVYGNAFLGTTFYDNTSYALAVDKNDCVFISGYFSGVVDFDPGPGVINLTSTGRDIYIAKLNQNGKLIFVRRANGNNDAASAAMTVDNAGNLFLTGGFKGNLSTNPPAASTLTSLGDWDILFMKYAACSVTNSLQTISRCNYYVSPSGNYTWTASGNYVDTIYNAGGCDSIININLTILPFSAPVIVGDSLICQGETTALALSTSYASYIWSNGSTAPSITIGATGNYTVTVTAANGCSGAAGFHLTVSNPIVQVSPQGATTFCQGDSVLLTATPGFASYQWLRRNYVIAGATLSGYFAKNSGGYKCIVQNTFLCTDTSNSILVNVPCVPIGPNHEKEISNNDYTSVNFHISPNPASDVLTIVSDGGQLEVLNMQGELIYTMKIFSRQTTLNVSEFKAGIYTFKLKYGGTTLLKKIAVIHN
jgi:hypothetical protein